MSSQTTGSANTLESIKKQTVQNNSVLCDKLDALKDALQCIGTVDDWGEETLITFLNQLAQLLVACKSEVEKHTVFWGAKWEDATLCELLENIRHQLDEIHQLIECVENRTVKTGFEKMAKELEVIDSVVNSIRLIEGKVKILSDAFEEDGLIKDLYNKQKDFSDDLISHKEQMEEIDKKLDSMCISAEQLTSLLSDTTEQRKSEISTLNDTFKKNNDTVLEKVECFMLQSRKRFTYIAAGTGFLALTNIVMFIMLLIK